MKNILVVEDDRLLGRLLKQKLEFEHFQVILTKNVDDALKAVRENEITLIYLDMYLPGEKDGFDFLREIKNDPQGKSIPVLILSNMGELSQMERATELGADDYLLKVTLNLDQLAQITRDHLLED